MYPGWWKGPHDLGTFAVLVNEALRFKQGRRSLFFEFTRGDPLPNVRVSELMQIVASIPMDTSLSNVAGNMKAYYEGL